MPKRLSRRATGERRLQDLERRIRAARSTLATLRGAIDNANGNAGLVALRAVTAENQELHQRNSRASAEADATNVALRDAIRASETDSLTQLSNRAVLWDRLAHDIAVSSRRGASLAVCFLDLDDFKQVNDRFGHEAGDVVLQHVAVCLVRAVRQGDTVCRLGGDEFVVVFCDIQPGDAASLAGKIHAALDVPVVLAGEAVRMTASVGTSLFPDDAPDGRTLVASADAAMYDAKRIRRARLPGLMTP